MWPGAKHGTHEEAADSHKGGVNRSEGKQQEEGGRGPQQVGQRTGRHPLNTRRADKVSHPGLHRGPLATVTVACLLARSSCAACRVYARSYAIHWKTKGSNLAVSEGATELVLSIAVVVDHGLGGKAIARCVRLYPGGGVR